MGIPYSKQINYAFDQVTPLVAEGFQVLEKTKNIAVVLLWLEILSALIIALNLVCLLALLITLNPDLEEERRQLVTPAVKWIAAETAKVFGILGRWWIVVVVVSLISYGGLIWTYYQYGGDQLEEIGEEDENKAEGSEGGKDKGKGKKKGADEKEK